MSGKALEWAIEQHVKPGAYKAVLMSIAHHFNQKTHVSFPGYELIGKESGNSRATVARAVRHLEDELGLIEVELYEHAKGGNGSNRYYLPDHDPQSVKPPERHRRPTFDGDD